MKTKVIIEHGQTKIILTPENDFESDISKKVFDDRSNFDLSVRVSGNTTHWSSDDTTDHRFEIDIVKKHE